MGSVAYVEEDVHRLARLGVCLMDMSNGSVIVHNGSKSSLVAEVKEKQDSDPILLQLKGLGTQVNLSIAFHPQMDGQTERTIPIVEDMLRACVINFKGSWDDELLLIEFAYNNNFHSSIEMDPYEALYGRRCMSPIGWFEVGETALIGPVSVHEAMEKVQLINDRLKTAQSRHKSYADVRGMDLEFKIDDWIFLKVSPMKAVMRFDKKGKLSPRYVGPYIPRKGDPALIVPLESVVVKDSLTYEEVPVEVLDRQ
ncbi:hypothetical protein MTR67_035775, partial [Solanum verrucosum]